MKTYKYVGTVGTIRSSWHPEKEIGLYNFENHDIPPVRVSARGDMIKYIDDLYEHDDEEKRLEKEFYYDELFNLLAIVVPGENENPEADDHPAKVVVTDFGKDGEVRFYGTDKRINDQHPKSMSEEEFNRLYNDMNEIGAFEIYEYPIDYWSSLRFFQRALEKRIEDLEDRLSVIEGIARNAE